MCFEIWVNLSIKSARFLWVFFLNILYVFRIDFRGLLLKAGMLVIRSESNAPINNHMIMSCDCILVH